MELSRKKKKLSRKTILEDPFESEVSKTTIETERSKEEMSFKKRPFGEALSQIDNRTMHVRLDVFFEQEQVVNDNNGTNNDEMTTAEEAEQTVSVIDGG